MVRPMLMDSPTRIAGSLASWSSDDFAIHCRQILDRPRYRYELSSKHARAEASDG
jgi:hypothetical protein